MLTTMEADDRSATVLSSISVAAVVVTRDGHGPWSRRRILAVQRVDNGEWELPGGVLEPGEKPLDGLYREVQEEANYSLGSSPQCPSPELTGLYHHRGLGVMALVYKVSLRTRDPLARCARLHACDEVGAVRWMTLREVRREMPTTFAVRVIDAVKFEHGGCVVVRSHNGNMTLNSCSTGWLDRLRSTFHPCVPSSYACDLDPPKSYAIKTRRPHPAGGNGKRLAVSRVAMSPAEDVEHFVKRSVADRHRKAWVKSVALDSRRSTLWLHVEPKQGTRARFFGISSSR